MPGALEGRTTSEIKSIGFAASATMVLADLGTRAVSIRPPARAEFVRLIHPAPTALRMARASRRR